MHINHTTDTRKDAFELFKYSVQRVYSLGLMRESNTHQTWANLIFNDINRADDRSELMSKVKREYATYFDTELQYRFLEDKIKAYFPSFFKEGEEEDDLFTRILKALEAEYTEQKDPRNKKIYKVSSFETITSQANLYLYKASLIVEEGDDPHFAEGMPFDYRTLETTYACESVEYDYVNAVLFFTSERIIRTSYQARVISDATMNTLALIHLLEECAKQDIPSSIPLYKFLNHTTCKLSTLEHGAYPRYLDQCLCRDLSQEKAFRAALSHDITFIWGPPGTGKSYTLAVIIMALYHMQEERTAVCCLSNIAVDQLVNKVIDISHNQEEILPGQLYRAGRTQDVSLLQKDFLFPGNIQTKLCKERIKRYCQEIDVFKQKRQQYSDEAIRIKAQLKNERERLKDLTNDLINKVKVVFSTISNFVINPQLKDGEFDNLIVDEASMLAEPQLIALARKVRKRIILVGDFQQLSPITIAGLPILKDNVFKLCGIDIDHSNHPALYQLLNQRRSNPQLVDLINKTFYNNQLHAVKKEHSLLEARAPYSGLVLGMRCVENGEVQFTKGGTRQNMENAKAVMKLLDIYNKEDMKDFSIGVITPYKGQVSLLKALFLEKNYDLDFQERVKIGTVHTFQGSECDVILFDMVDCSNFSNGKKAYFGKIYAGDQGEQLLNVAISRARDKLIVICDPEYIRICPGGTISEKSFDIFKKLLKARCTLM